MILKGFMGASVLRLALVLIPCEHAGPGHVGHDCGQCSSRGRTATTALIQASPQSGPSFLLAFHALSRQGVEHSLSFKAVRSRLLRL